jgi:hypothetical protein
LYYIYSIFSMINFYFVDNSYWSVMSLITYIRSDRTLTVVYDKNTIFCVLCICNNNSRNTELCFIHENFIN